MNTKLWGFWTSDEVCSSKQNPESDLGVHIHLDHWLLNLPVLNLPLFSRELPVHLAALSGRPLLIPAYVTPAALYLPSVWCFVLLWNAFLSQRIWYIEYRTRFSPVLQPQWCIISGLKNHGCFCLWREAACFCPVSEGLRVWRSQEKGGGMP